MSGQIAAWHAEHLNFAHLLRLLEDQVRRFAQGDTPDYGLMQDIVHYLRNFPDLHHHRYEDEVYGRMRARDPRLGPLVARLLQEHRVIAASGEKLYALIDAVLNDGAVARADLEAAAATYLVYYRAHIDAEETLMLPQVAAALTAADWQDVAGAVAARAPGDPLFGPHAEQRFRALRLAIERSAAAAQPDGATA